MERLIAIMVALVLAIPCSAGILTVDDNGPADYQTIQAAIDKSLARGHGRRQAGDLSRADRLQRPADHRAKRRSRRRRGRAGHRDLRGLAPRASSSTSGRASNPC